MRLPKAKVFAFDIDSKARQLCSEMATLNSVGDRVIVEVECRIEQLEALSEKRTLGVCDCEGCEQEFSPKDRRIAVAEFRDGKMQWAFMKARHLTSD